MAQQEVQLWDPATQKAWEQIRGETDLAYEAFKMYLQLQPRLGNDGHIRRVLSDLSQTDSRRKQSFHEWYRVWQWEKRAEAYDLWLQPLATSSLIAEKRKYAERLHKTSQQLFDLADQIYAKLKDKIDDTYGLEDAIKVSRLAATIGERAVRIGEPVEEIDQEQLDAEIEKTVELFAAGLEELADGAKASIPQRDAGEDDEDDYSPLRRRTIPQIPGLP